MRSAILVSTRIVVIFIALLAMAREAGADRRVFGFTYPYQTLPQGGFEIEHYLDAGLDRFDDPSTDTVVEDSYRVDWRHQLEFEYGITDHLDFGFYNVLRQKPYGNLEYRGPKIRSRYRFAERGELFVDPAVYLEIAYFGDEMEIEQRIILAKMFGRLETSLNLKFEEEIKFEEEETEFEFAFVPSLGVAYHFTDHLAVGVEYLGELVVEHGELEDYAQYLGPSISVSGKHFWWTITFLTQVSDAEGQVRFLARSLFGIVF